LLCLVPWGASFPIAEAADMPAPSCVLVEKEGKIELARKGSTVWTAAKTNDELQVGDRLRTALRSRATLRWSELSVVRVSELTSLELQAPAAPSVKPQLDLRSGAAYFFSRERPADVRFRTPVASGAIRGTEFALEVAESGRTVLSLLDGEVDLANGQGAALLKSGEQGVVEPGHAPAKTALIDAINVIQWALYYPAVVDLDDLGLSDQEKESFKESLEAYRQGDLLASLGRYPENRAPASDAERALRAALLLAAGRAEQTEAELSRLPPSSPPANAFREIIAAVKHQTLGSLPTPATGSEWMARSYYLQSRGQLADALKAARNAASNTADWSRRSASVAGGRFSG